MAPGAGDAGGCGFLGVGEFVFQVVRGDPQYSCGDVAALFCEDGAQVVVVEAAVFGGQDSLASSGQL